jgi:subtilisin family serine protease
LPDYRFFATYPDDDYFNNQWGLNNTGQAGGTPGFDIDTPEAWVYEKGSESVKIGIIDTGVKEDHEDLSGKVSGEQGFSDGHGTDVSSSTTAGEDRVTRFRFGVASPISTV